MDIDGTTIAGAVVEDEGSIVEQLLVETPVDAAELAGRA